MRAPSSLLLIFSSDDTPPEMFDSKQSRKGISASTVIVVLNLVQLWDASEAVGVADRHSREKHRQHTRTHQYFLSSNQIFNQICLRSPEIAVPLST
jgi:hypothetical protein